MRKPGKSDFPPSFQSLKFIAGNRELWGVAGEQEMEKAGWECAGAEQDFSPHTAFIPHLSGSPTHSYRFLNSRNSQQSPLANFIFQSFPSEFALATMALEANVHNRDTAALAGNRELLFLHGALDSIMFWLKIGNKQQQTHTHTYTLRFWAESGFFKL